MTSDDDILAAIEARRNDEQFMTRLKANMRKLGIPVGTDDPTLLALGARPLEAEHQCRYPAPNGQGFPVNQCLDCGGWIIAELDTTPPPNARGSSDG